MMIETVDAGERQISRAVVVDAPVSELYALVANPKRHEELDGSGTVRGNRKGGDLLKQGEKFSTAMKMFGIPYTMTCTSTQVVPDKVVEWQHPGGHKWRYEFTSLGPNRTRVTETWDYRDSKFAKVYELIGYRGRNAKGIEATLEKLAQRYGSAVGGGERNFA